MMSNVEILKMPGILLRDVETMWFQYVQIMVSVKKKLAYETFLEKLARNIK
jgi:hypothetical protein